MAKQDVKVEIFYDGIWHDIAADDEVFERDPIVCLRGDGDESAAPRPAQVNATLDNRAQKYNPRDPMSPLYGKAGRNTPCRLTVGSSVRNVVQLSSWAPDRSIDYTPAKYAATGRGDAWTEIEGGGLLRAIGQDTEPLRSAFFRSSVRYTTSTGYWSGEDGRRTSIISSAGPGGPDRPALATSDTHDAIDGPVSSDRLFTNGDEDGYQIEGTFASGGSGTTGWEFSFVSKLVEEPTGGNSGGLMNITATGDWYWQISVLAGQYRLSVGQVGGVVNASTDFSNDGIPPDRWLLWILSVTRSGSTCTWTLRWIDEFGQEGVQTGTFTSSDPGTLSGWFIQTSEWNREAGYGHIIGINGHAENLYANERFNAWIGHRGETTADRFGRLMNEEGRDWTLVGASSDGINMGVQPIDTLTGLLQEIRDTEDGLLFDTRDSVGLTFVTRPARYNRPVVLELTWPGDISMPLPQVIDDLDTHNLITVKQRDGGQAVVEKTDGPLSTEQPPDGVGVAKQTIDVNVWDQTVMLPELAYHWLNRGTVDASRYPQVTVDLVARPGLATAAAAVDIGDVISLAGIEADPVIMYVIGIKEVIGTHTRKITYTCRPNQHFDVGEYDSTARRADSKTSTLNANATTTGTSLVVRFTSYYDGWSTTAEPYDWIVGGERIRVTSMGAITGSGPYTQTATVQRSINGVVKSHTGNSSGTGAAVHMHPAQAARYGLRDRE
jgi:hypothetical protein